METTKYEISEGPTSEVIVTERFTLELPDEKAMGFAHKWESPVIVAKKLSEDASRYEFVVLINTENTEAHFDYDEQDMEFDADKEEALGLDQRYDGQYIWGSVKDSSTANKLLKAWCSACQDLYPHNDFRCW